jgi:hypothetical protein
MTRAWRSAPQLALQRDAEAPRHARGAQSRRQQLDRRLLRPRASDRRRGTASANRPGTNLALIVVRDRHARRTSSPADPGRRRLQLWRDAIGLPLGVTVLAHSRPATGTGTTGLHAVIRGVWTLGFVFCSRSGLISNTSGPGGTRTPDTWFRKTPSPSAVAPVRASRKNRASYRLYLNSAPSG